MSTGDRFDGNRNYVSGNGTVVVKVVSDGRNLRGCIRGQSAYIELGEITIGVEFEWKMTDR